MSKPTKNKCGACGKPWVGHDGIARTCAKLDRARRTLRAIHNACKKALEETESGAAETWKE